MKAVSFAEGFHFLQRKIYLGVSTAFCVEIDFICRKILFSVAEFFLEVSTALYSLLLYERVI